VSGRLGHAGRQEGNRRLDQPSQRRFADPAETETGHGDAQLRRGDVAVRIADGAADRARAAVPLGNHLIDTGLAHRDDRELRGHEESVGEDQRQDRRQPPRNRCERMLHDVTLANAAGQEAIGAVVGGSGCRCAPPR
jgi:hypothetical protein